MNDGSTKSRDDAPASGETIRAEVEALKRELADLIAHIKTGAAESVSNEAHRLLDAVADEHAEAVEALRGYVETRPLTAIAIAFGIGFVASRVLKR
jgi:ElaB/YqjD/DUF883 family membrane-anchored ribosome-binding protein